jgi:hypothetical protein
MTRRLGLIVTDASPLFTLVLTDALDILVVLLPDFYGDSSFSC